MYYNNSFNSGYDILKMPRLAFIYKANSSLRIAMVAPPKSYNLITNYDISKFPKPFIIN